MIEMTTDRKQDKNMFILIVYFYIIDQGFLKFLIGQDKEKDLKIVIIFLYIS